MSNIYSGLKSFGDYQRANDEFMLKKQLQEAQIGKALKDANETDITKLGEQAFLKAGQGIPLTPQETAAARFLDAKSGGMQFDPSTGVAVKKPSLFDKLPINGQPAPAAPAMGSPVDNADPPADWLSGAGNPPTPETPQPRNNNLGQFEKAYREQLAAASGNPKLQQTIKSNYAKSVMEANEDEAKNAGFADRMKTSQSIMDSPEKEKAATDPKEIFKAAIPLLGNFIVSNDYQSYNQAQRDFINAQLRRESGAVISPQEFANAEKQYFPKAGDSPETLLQKKANREQSLAAIISGAGASYEYRNKLSPAEAAAQKADNFMASKARGQGEFEAKKGIQTLPNGWKVQERK